MTNLFSRASNAGMPMYGPTGINIISVDCQQEGEGPNAPIFEDLLANVARETEFSDGGASDRSSSDRTCEPGESICLLPTGLPEPMTRFEVVSSSKTTPVASSNSCGSTPMPVLDGSMLLPAQTNTNEVDPADSLEPPQGMVTGACQISPSKSTEKPARSMTLFARLSGVATKEAVGSGRDPDFGGRENVTFVSKSDLEAVNAIASRSSFAAPTAADTTSGTPSSPTSEPTFALPIHITGLESYFPAIIARTAVELTESVKDHVRMTGEVSSAGQPEACRVKILTFDVHPAALGPLTVRMKIIGKQIEIVIDTRSEDVRATLAQSSDAMIEALAGHGLRVEPPDIRLTISTPEFEPKHVMQDQNAQADAGGFTQDQRHAHHDQRHGSTRYRSPIEDQSPIAPDGTLDSDNRTGIYL